MSRILRQRVLSRRGFVEVFHGDHIVPQSEFQVGALKKRGYGEARVKSYLSKYNSPANLQLLTDSENFVEERHALRQVDSDTRR